VVGRVWKSYFSLEGIVRLAAILLMVGIGIGIGVSIWMSREGTPVLHPDDPRNTTGERGIVLLVADWCGYCRKLQSDFEHGNVRYRTLDVETDEGKRAMNALGMQEVPVTVIGQDVIQGYDPAKLGSKLASLGYDLY
jgi:glutaredoxin